MIRTGHFIYPFLQLVLGDCEFSHPIGNIVSRKRVPSQSADWMIKVHSGYSCEVATVESERI